MKRGILLALGLLFLSGCQTTTELSTYNLKATNNKVITINKSKGSFGAQDILSKLMSQINMYGGYNNCPCSEPNASVQGATKIWGKSVTEKNKGKGFWGQETRSLKSHIAITYYNGDNYEGKDLGTELVVLIKYELIETDDSFVLTLTPPADAVLSPKRSFIFIPYESLYSEIELQNQMDKLFKNITIDV